jgi:sensor histidine kinase regulating citrate/malate metabolism
MLNINQSLSDTVLSLTPNLIIAVDSAMLIKEFNVAAQRLFKISRNAAIGKKISELIDDTDFRQVIETKTSIFDKTVYYKDLGLITSQSITYSAEYNMAIATITDITYEEMRHRLAYDKKMQSLELVQKVIDKQMFVAQQIAGLLGETTAETKVALSKLKTLIAEENDANE